MNRLLLVGLVLLGAAFGALGTWLAERVAPGDLGASDKTRIERVVRDYILANPEILPQAMQKLQDRDTATQVTGIRGAIETPYGNAWEGNPQGDVTIVEYFDYNCGYCRAMLPITAALLKADPQVRIVYRDLPILAESSRDAARASLQAAAQGKFPAFHRALYAAGPVTAASIAQTARATGVDLGRTPPRGDDELAANLATASKLGMNGTPSWVVGDRVLTGAVAIDRLREAIAAARAR